MEGAKFEGSNAQYDEYKKTCPPAWIVSTRFRQDETGDVRIGELGGMCSKGRHTSENGTLLTNITNGGFK